MFMTIGKMFCKVPEIRTKLFFQRNNLLVYFCCRKSKKGKAPPVPQTQQNEAQNADADTQEQKNGKGQKPASENKNGDDQSVSSKKERIGKLVDKLVL